MDYIISLIIPIFILVIFIVAIIEKKDSFKFFIDGVIDGLKTVYKIFPYIFSIMVAMNLLNKTGAMNILLIPIKPLLVKLQIPSDVIPLCLLRPLSGGASMSIVIDIFKTNGPDSVSGKIASVIMGATETTFYTITILFGAIKQKKYVEF